MVNPPIRVRLYLHNQSVYLGSLYKREIIVGGSEKQWQIWVKTDIDPTTTVEDDMYLLDERVMQIDIIYDRQSEKCIGL
jgi:hypothetical protein